MDDRTALCGERPRPAAVRNHPNAGWFVVATVCFGAFMGQLDASIVTLVFPALQTEFGLPLAAVEWVSLAYLLALIGLLAAAGRLADAAGRWRWVFLVNAPVGVVAWLAGRYLLPRTRERTPLGRFDGIGVAAVGAGRLLPRRLGHRGLSVIGTGVVVAGCVALAVTPRTPGVAGPLLVLVGLGLGVFVPANNAVIMGAVPPRASASGGSLVNMARGLGTAFGVAMVAFSLHVGRTGGGATLALWTLVVVAVVGGLVAVGSTSRGMV